MALNITSSSLRIAKAKFMCRMAADRLLLRSQSCPYCESDDTRLVKRKYLLIDLRRCARCGIMFRWPKDSVQRNARFYQKAYRQSMTPVAPEQPEPAEEDTFFANTGQDISARIGLLRTLVPTGRVLDYGSSWGYGTYQLLAAGYQAVGFEISQPRADFARARLGVSTITDLAELHCDNRNAFDAIFASHVLEHLPSLAGVFERFVSLLAPGGLLLAFVPNCGGLNARRFGVRWGPMCCEEHTIAFDAGFFERNLPRHGFKVLSFSDPYSPDLLSRLHSADSVAKPTNGDELVICAWKLADHAGSRPQAGSQSAELNSRS
jgi:SAM-dependent methyltransferase